MTKAGKDRISQLMVGRYFKSPAQIDRALPSVRSKVERIAAPLAQVDGKPGWDLTPDVQGALDLLDQARKVSVKSVDDFVRQDGLFGKDKWSDKSVAIAKALALSKPTEVTAAARQYARDAAYADKGQSLMGDAPTPEPSFKDSFGALKSGPESDAAKLIAKAGKPTAVASAEDGPHGPIFTEHRGDWPAARDRLLSERTGEVPGALTHKATGPIDVAYGDGKYGLSKIADRHPEVLDDLQGILDKLDELKDTRTENSIHLGSDQYHAVIRRNWKGNPKTWLLTAFDKTIGK